MDSALSDVIPERVRRGAHALHPYFGKVNPALARAIISSYSDVGSLVMDPFCGSGTVLTEALLARRNAVGWDSSKLATSISVTKHLGLSQQEKELLECLCQELLIYADNGPLLSIRVPNVGAPPPMRRIQNVKSWFGENALIELAFLRQKLQIGASKDLTALDMMKQIAFSRIIVSASNQQGESNYRRVAKQDSPGRVISLFISSVRHVVRCLQEFDVSRIRSGIGGERSVCSRQTKTRVQWQDITLSVYKTDTRAPQLDALTPKADLVVTSPPYLMSWDYGLYHKFRFYWLDIDLDGYEDTEIGRHLRRQNDDVPKYSEDMMSALGSISSAMNSGGHLALINAPAVVYGKLVDTNEILQQVGERAGMRFLSCQPSIAIPGPHHGMYASLDSRSASAPGESGKQEHVILFQKP